MRSFLFCLLLWPAVALAGNGSYTYTSVNSLGDGDSFNRIANYSTDQKTGSITITRSSLKIDDKEFKLKSTNDRSIYRLKGGMVKFMYEKRQLIAVQLYQYNQAYRFNIAPAATPATPAVANR